MARPTMYTDELGTEICLRIAEGQSLRSICKSEDMPSTSSVSLWLVDGKHQAFSAQYTVARQAQAVLMAEELMDIADDGTNDYKQKNMPDGSTSEVFDTDHYQRSRLRVDTRKWYLSKVLTKVYGDKHTIDNTSSDGTMTPKGATINATMSAEEASEIYKDMISGKTS